MGNAKIGIIYKNGEIKYAMNLNDCSPIDLCVLLSNVEIIKNDLLDRYRITIRREDGIK